jgi:polyisoprenoid-binding protein YceI
MRKCLPSTLTILTLGVLCAAVVPARAADSYAVDPAHSCVSFKIQHLGISWIHGRFNEFSGNFSLDKTDPAKSEFSLTIKTGSIDTNQKKRDEHLHGPDFFNVKQFPILTFKSTTVKAVEGGYQVTGDLAFHGTTRSITFTLQGGKEAQFPPGVARIGFVTDLVLKRSEFGMDKLLNAVGDDVHVSIGLEGLKQ